MEYGFTSTSTINRFLCKEFEMTYLKYSIIWGLIRLEISEQISLGIIYVDENKITVRYSEQKLQAMKLLVSQASYETLQKVLYSMTTDNPIKSVEEISYLSRYSNNLIGFSELKEIKLEATEENKEWLFRNYVSSETQSEP